MPENLVMQQDERIALKKARQPVRGMLRFLSLRQGKRQLPLHVIRRHVPGIHKQTHGLPPEQRMHGLLSDKPQQGLKP